MPRPALAQREQRAPTGRPVAALGRALLILLTLGPAPAAARERWPLWPSEVQRVAEPLRGGQARNRLVSEAHRLQALRALERYPTELVAPLLLEALADPTTAVRREALQACLERELHACMPAAALEWASPRPDLGVRIAALRVLALDVTAAGRPELLLAALREDDEALRTEAAYTLARVPWPDELLPQVRTALIARLADPIPLVRRAAARALGLLGPPPATYTSPPRDPAPTTATPTAPPRDPAPTTATPTTPPRDPAPTARLLDPAPLALARLLADPDPQVRQDAAEALGALRDPRAAGPLLRVIEAGDETFVSRTLILALAALPGPEVDAALLRLLDVPPRALTHRHISEALGRRFAPSPALITGLINRLREQALQAPILDILLQYGAAAGPALREARDRGLEPPLALPVARLLAALDPPASAPSRAPTWPAADQREAWHQRLADPTDALAAARALADEAPPWLGPAALGALHGATGPAQRRPWLLALALAPRPLLPADDALTPARLAGWVADAGLPVLDRCLALAALDRGHPPAHAARARAALEHAASDPRPAMRACAAAIATEEPLLAALLHDESPRVRAVASFHVAACPLRPARSTRSHIARLAHDDRHPGVVRAATAALAHLQAPSPEPCSLVLLDLGEPRARTHDLAGPGWVDLRWRDQDLRLPVEALGARRYLLLPGLDDAVPLDQEPTPPRPELR